MHREREALAPHLRPDPQVLGAEWAALVAADREQVERLREERDEGDHWQSIARHFLSDPRRRDDPTLDTLLAYCSPDRAWLDVGAGAGRYALPLALHSRRVIAVEPSPAMRAAMLDSAREHGIANLEVRAAAWPDATDGAEDIEADFSLMSHVGYDLPAINTFLDTLEAATRERCFAFMMDRVPNSGFDQLWLAVHGEPRVRLPAARELITLLLARGATPEVRLFPRGGHDTSEEHLRESLRRRLWLVEGSDKDRRAQALLDGQLAGGRQEFGLPSLIALISWQPPMRRSGA